MTLPRYNPKTVRRVDCEACKKKKVAQVHIQDGSKHGYWFPTPPCCNECNQKALKIGAFLSKPENKRKTSKKKADA